VRRRGGFTLIELLAVLCIVGVLAVVAVPQLLKSTGTARGSALVGRVRSVQVAYTSANAPDAEALTSGSGVVPEAFRASLNPGHFTGEAGVQLSVVGEGRDVWLRLEANSPEGMRALDAFHVRAGAGHLHSGNIALVPLSTEAMDLVEAINASNGGNAPTRMASGAGDGATTASSSSGSASGSSSGSIGSSGSSNGALTPGGERSTDENNSNAAVPCSPTLPAPVYNRCLSATSSGWFRR
jgi:prepilin-type N-terminal cleavage/methylation domain-containing protein